MYINKKLLSKWKALRSPEDTLEISRIAGVTPQTVRNALKNGKCTANLYVSMGSHYKAKEKIINQFK